MNTKITFRKASGTRKANGLAKPQVNRDVAATKPVAPRAPAKRKATVRPAAAQESLATDQQLVSRSADSAASAANDSGASRRRQAKATPTGFAPARLRPYIDPANGCKQARLIALLVDSGATLNQMMTLTGWQAHTVRGTISGVMRKKLGLNVICEKSSESGERRYHIVPAVGA
jgi:hypothetical protein